MKIIHKTSNIAGSIPTSLDNGEIAVNSKDSIIYFNKDGVVTNPFKKDYITMGDSFPEIDSSHFGTIYQTIHGAVGFCTTNTQYSTMPSEYYWMVFDTKVNPGDRGVFGGGITQSSGDMNTIDYITISNTGDATDFGDLTEARDGVASSSNSTGGRGVFAGGNLNNVIDYFTILIASDCTDFGDLTISRYRLGSASNGTNDRGVFGGGYDTSNTTDVNTIDYITISTTPTCTDFGDLTVARDRMASTSNGTNERGIFAAGHTGSSTSVIDYITISTTGNATDFGNASPGNEGPCGVSNGTNERGIIAGGTDGSPGDEILYITISTVGNSTDFGDLSDTRRYMGGTSNATNERGIFAGGYDGSSGCDIIEYITISTTGDASDFGDLTVARQYLAGTSDA